MLHGSLTRQPRGKGGTGCPPRRPGSGLPLPCTASGQTCPDGLMTLKDQKDVGPSAPYDLKCPSTTGKDANQRVTAIIEEVSLWKRSRPTEQCVTDCHCVPEQAPCGLKTSR